ncbi:alpha/beta hydrolase [Flavobacterium sp. J27]|uniref:alpha/beta hydrolase n=1 Tax=Flavobacterium sp. J27 TaxID=2060419 RepID=UPI0010319FA1|nr:alpha/beta hydrolase-fold protein [Flavobacterium sp. J27]
MKKVGFLFIIFFLTSWCLWSQKRFSQFEIKAPQLDTVKRIWIYLPLDYDLSEKKYPVLYMHDAQNLFDEKTAFSGEWKIDETLDSLQAKIIVVGIEHGNEKRINELTPFKNDKYGGGEADNYLDFIVTTLKPYIDSVYRTKINSKNTGIMGSSLGGLVSFYASLKYPDIFGKVGVFSPSFWFTNDIYTLTEQTKKIDTKYYFMCGDSEDESMVDNMNKMIHLIRQKRCDCLHLHKTKIVANGKHNEKLWSKEFAKAYLWLF